MTEIVWKDWKHQQVTPWQGCLLSLNLNPSRDWFSGRQSTIAPNAVQINPKRFPSNEIYLEFEKRQKLILDNRDRINSEDIFDFSSRSLWKVKSPVFAKLALDLEISLPPEFAAFATLSTPSQSKDKWPWGSYETKSLIALAAAVEKFWAGYDKEKPERLPKQPEIMSWLESKYGIKGTNAKYMAIMIRPDDAPSGPMSVKKKKPQKE